MIASNVFVLLHQNVMNKYCVIQSDPLRYYLKDVMDPITKNLIIFVSSNNSITAGHIKSPVHIGIRQEVLVAILLIPSVAFMTSSSTVLSVQLIFLHDYCDPMIFLDFEECVNNIYCAIETVRGYMKKRIRDCNHDGRISCGDFALVHKAGPKDCHHSWVRKTKFWRDYTTCSVSLHLK